MTSHTKSLGLRFILSVVCLLLTALCWVKYRDAHFAQEQELRDRVCTLECYARLVDHYYGQGDFSSVVPVLPEGIKVEVLDADLRVVASSDRGRVGSKLAFPKNPELRTAYYQRSGHRLDQLAENEELSRLSYATYGDQHYVRLSSVYPTSEDVDRETLWIVCLIPCLLILLGMLAGTYMRMRAHDKSTEALKHLTSALQDGSIASDSSFAQDDLGELGRELIRLFTTHKANRLRLEETRQHLIGLFDLSKIGIALFDSSGTTLFANTHFIQFASMISSKALPKESLAQLLTEDSMKPILDFLVTPPGEQKSVSTMIPSGSHIFEVKAYRTAGETFDLSIEDVTVVEQATQLKREMTSNITHEIRTPLTSIRGYLETLRYTDLTPEQRASFTDKAYQQAERLSQMMDDIRLISHMDEKSIADYRMEDVNLWLVAEEARIAFADQIEKKGDTFINDIPDGLTIRANNSLIHSIFQNMVENSLHYAGDGVTLCFDCYHQDEDYVYLSYYDTGKGVPEEKLGRIFERFYRIDSGRTRSQGGSGLGLSIVRNAIRRHRGQIQARRHSPQGGLEFLFTLHK